MGNFTFPTYRALANYRENLSLVFLRTFESIKHDPSSEKMIEIFSEEGLYDQLSYHQKLLVGACEFQSSTILFDYLQWRCRVLQARGISQEYLSFEYEQWQKSLWLYLFEPYATEFQHLYEQCITFCSTSFQESSLYECQHEMPIKQLTDALLESNEEKASLIFAAELKRYENFLTFFDNLIHPTMTLIGSLWECGKISVAKEHLATAIIERLCERFAPKNQPYPLQPSQQPPLALVIKPQTQLHTMGIKLIQSLFEAKGYRCAHIDLEENTLEASNAAILFNPAFIVCSISLPIFIPIMQRFIDKLKSDKIFQGKIIVGGQALYRTSPPIYLQNVDFQGKTLKELEKFLEEKE